jgi:hypothetical protein
MIECNRFDVSLNVSGDEIPIVIFVIRTDLPSGTQIISTCRRSYRDAQGTDSLWVGQSDRLVVCADGECRGRIDINASDKKASDYFRQLNTGHSSPGISSPISDTVELGFMVGGRQRLREFGRNNSELSGTLVTERGGIKVVEAVRKLRIPMKSSLQPTMTSS